ncbi:hypothetical protein FAIPA1_100102 [Frankia sp. AiPs1]
MVAVTAGAAVLDVRMRQCRASAAR